MTCYRIISPHPEWGHTQNPTLPFFAAVRQAARIFTFHVRGTSGVRLLQFESSRLKIQKARSEEFSRLKKRDGIHYFHKYSDRLFSLCSKGVSEFRIFMLLKVQLKKGKEEATRAIMIRWPPTGSQQEFCRVSIRLLIFVLKTFYGFTAAHLT